MPIVNSLIRNSPQNFLCTSILFFISFLAAVVLYIYRGIFTYKIDLTNSTSLYLLYFGISTTIVFSSFMHRLLLFGFEDFLNGKNSDVLNRLWKYLKNHEYLWNYILLYIASCIFLVIIYLSTDLKLNWGYFLVIFSASIPFACMTVWADYDDVELSSSQFMDKSIGACWANGAYSAFYEKILGGITKRMLLYEKKQGIELLVKKLVMICPLSCNANGSLEGKDTHIEAAGCLEEIIDDEGANINRKLKTNVYKIRGILDYYIAAEIPSPLATLYEMRDVMDNSILQYHRKCFVETLKDLLRSNQCIILEYDDLNASEPLHSFLLSKLEDYKFVNVLK